MAPHLTPTELDQIAGMRQQRPAAILQAINAARERQEIEPVQVWAIRRALKGVTRKRGRSETRPVLSRLEKLLCGRRLKRQWNLPGGVTRGFFHRQLTLAQTSPDRKFQASPGERRPAPDEPRVALPNVDANGDRSGNDIHKNELSQAFSIAS